MTTRVAAMLLSIVVWGSAANGQQITSAFIFESDDRVFTFSMHQQHNYPMWKPRGSLDIGLPDTWRRSKRPDWRARAVLTSV